ncbi:MAG: DUF6489 family protein [Gammaproteobacteria bacterium]|jgi:hypothetical protein|nr:DUF6489 family protein [Gammaproteobacteria bacterium]
MQIKIEIDVKPEELRRFLGLPDVAGLQEDLINFLRDKLGSAAETFDPSSFVKENLQSLKASAPWQLIVSATKSGVRSGTRSVKPVVKTGARRVRKAVTAVGETVAAKPAAKRRKPAARKAAPKSEGSAQ